MKRTTYFVLFLLLSPFSQPFGGLESPRFYLSPESEMTSPGKRLEPFLLAQLPEGSGHNIPGVVRVYMAKQISHFYLKEFFRSVPEGVIPVVSPLEELYFSGSILEEDKKIAISLTNNFKYHPLPEEESLNERARAISQFVIDVYQLVRSQNIDEEHFLSLLLEPLQPQQKAIILSNLLVDYQSGTESELFGPHAISYLDSLLKNERKRYENISPAANDSVLKVILKDLDQFISAFPGNPSQGVSSKANQFLLSLFGAKNEKLADKAKALFAARTKIETRHVRRPPKPEKPPVSSSI